MSDASIHSHETTEMLWMFGAGLLTGMGQLLNSDQKLCWRIIVGRMITSGTLGAAAGTILLVTPDLPLPAEVGLACALVSLGTSAIERLVQRALGGK